VLLAVVVVLLAVLVLFVVNQVVGELSAASAGAIAHSTEQAGNAR